LNKYKIDGITIDSVDLKCLIVSRGVKVDNAVYRYFKNKARLSKNPLCCNCFNLSDGTVVQLTDTNFHLSYLSGILGWDNLKLLKYIKEMSTPFSLRMSNDIPVLLHDNKEVDNITFQPFSDFYERKTKSGQSYTGNAVLQGLDWVAFQCLWPCEYAAAGFSCQFCFLGGGFESTAKKGKALPKALEKENVQEIVASAQKNEGISNIQITGGSTYEGHTERSHITEYLSAIKNLNPVIDGEIILFITPPADKDTIDEYFSLGTSRIACSIEVWDISLAGDITPGKIKITGRERHLQVLEYIAGKYGHAKACSNFIIGIEDFSTLKDGATWLAERGVLPTASVWMPMGRPVQGSMKAPDVDYYKRAKDLLAELYTKYTLEPTKSRGLNVCIGRDIWNYAISR